MTLSSKSWWVGAVVSLPIFVSGCNTSSRVAIAPQLPDIPPKLRAYCADPGVPDVAAESIIAWNRTYAACEKRKHRDIATFYDTVRTRFSR